jgi:hypothetical protein
MVFYGLATVFSTFPTRQPLGGWRYDYVPGHCPRDSVHFTEQQDNLLQLLDRGS